MKQWSLMLVFVIYGSMCTVNASDNYKNDVVNDIYDELGYYNGNYYGDSYYDQLLNAMYYFFNGHNDYNTYFTESGPSSGSSSPPKASKASKPPKPSKMPYDIVKGDGYCFELKNRIKYKSKKYKYLITKFIAKGPQGVITEYLLNNCPNWDNAIKYEKNNENVNFNVAEKKIKIGHGWLLKHKYEVHNCWLLKKKTSNIKPKMIPIKVAFQRAQVIIHAKGYFMDPLIFPPVRVQESAITLAAISMLAWYSKLQINDNFYDGKVVAIEELKDVQMHTHLTGQDEFINIGNLKLFAWKKDDIFVVSARGTVSDPKSNWPLNINAKAKTINFHPYGSNEAKANVVGEVHSGLYDVTERTLSQFLKVFDKYNDEKRIMFTGHSLGSGLSQMLILHLLNNNKKESLPQNVRDIIYPPKGSTKPHCSLEIMSFGGPAIMDNTISKKLKEALNRFNRQATNKPHSKYSALVFSKKMDPLSFTGDKAYNFFKSILDGEHAGSLSKLVLGMNVNSPRDKKLGIEGVDDFKKYKHFGKKVIVGSSHRTKNLDKNVAFLSHAEYLDVGIWNFDDSMGVAWAAMRGGGFKGWLKPDYNPIRSWTVTEEQKQLQYHSCSH